jgi:hypothetical protein
VFVSAAVCPHPPLLVPEVAQQPAAELDDLRRACDEAVAAMLGALPEVVVVAGDGPQMHRYDETDGGTLRGLGVDVRAGGAGSDALPLAHTLGAWLLDRAGWTGPRRYLALPRETTPAQCVETGQKTAAAGLRVAVLAMGDGTARRSEQAPGYLDGRAAPLDAEIARALAGPDLAWLGENPPPVACADLWVAGRQAWQFLAGAASQVEGGEPVDASVGYDAAPYGVGYFVATWATAR